MRNDSPSRLLRLLFFLLQGCRRDVVKRYSVRTQNSQHVLAAKLESAEQSQPCRCNAAQSHFSGVGCDAASRLAE